MSYCDIFTLEVNGDVVMSKEGSRFRLNIYLNLIGSTQYV